MKTIILLSTQTSATASICRIIETLNDGNAKFVGLEASKKNIIGNKFDDIPLEGHIVLHNRPDFLKHLKNPEKFRYIVNFRDPRDRLCNSFHWMQQHPFFPGEPIEKIKERALEIQKKGIDDWVLEAIKPAYELSLINFIRTIPDAEIQVATYADLCMNFDRFVNKVSDFIDVELTDELLQVLEPERCDNLKNNKEWIGSRWKGADIFPGRYKSELHINTVARLNNSYNEVLSQMALLDSDNQSLYLDKTIQSQEKIFKSLGVNNTPAEILRDVALAFEKIGDITTAIKIMEKAKLVRSNGPLINSKIQQYSIFLKNS